MKYASVRRMDISNGKGIGVALFVQGCPIHCGGCFQPETWDFDGGKEYTEGMHGELLRLLDKDYISRLSILGGEPLCEANIPGVVQVVLDTIHRHPELDIWVWSGYTYDRLLERSKEWQICWPSWNEKIQNSLWLYYILKHIDVLVAGPYIQEEKDLSLKWCGSDNQEVIDMQQTRLTGQKVLMEQ